MLRRALTLVAGVGLLGLGTGPAIAVLGDPQVVSVTDAGLPGAAAAQGASISATGRYVAFTSTDPLAGVATLGKRQLYVRDRETGRTLLASRGTGGAAADADVDDPADRIGYAISGDGRYAVFASTAGNLVATENDGGAMDVFRFDLATGVMRLVSRAPDGAPANGPVGGDPDVSYDGSRIVFDTGTATNLWPGDLSGASDVVLRDLVFGTSALVSAAPSGAALPGPVAAPAISADGRRAAFAHGSSVSVRLLDEGRTDLVSAAGAFPDLSGSGRVVAFERGGAVIRRDLATNVESTVAAGAGSPAVSADGLRVVVQSADPLIGADTNGATDVYARRATDPIERVSQRATGAEVARDATRPAVAGNGTGVGFALDDSTPSSSLAPGDADHQPDVLMAQLPATDLTGPQLAINAPAAGASVADAVVDVSGVAADPAGVVALSVAGYPAPLSGSGGFAVSIPLAVGTTAVTVTALDGAGNITTRTVLVTRPAQNGGALGGRARARALKIVRVRQTTQVRFILESGATSVGVRLWRRVLRPGRPPAWTAVGPLRRTSQAPGRRSAILARAALRPDVYQARVTVISPGGATVAVTRFVVPRAGGVR